ncbi:MAG TPA: hypothetical protein VFU71_15915 [Burkholderiaceae bacterium]|nr:hypothetical protein [Burkholderiaceae bacterium]
MARQRWAIGRREAIATLVLATAPDVMQLAPLLGGIFTRDGVALIAAYATALPGLEPTLPPTVAFAVHHLHCALHSAVVAAAVTLAVWLTTRSIWIPLLGWWSHIVIDAFTHSRDFYPVPVFYPFSDWGFDGLAWNTPWFLVANYAAICVVAALVVVAPRPGPRSRAS